MAVVTSVQYGSIAISGASSTATITAVDTTKAAVFYLGHSATGTLLSQTFARLVLTNATTVTALEPGSGSFVTVNFVVIEFASANSVQQGTITVSGATSNTATITSVNTAKSILIFDGISDQNGATTDQVFTRITLTNATTVTATKGTATNSVKVGFTVIEFA